eukprot:CAMPEP_0183777350 /NCGR_PEP_ID=MMETSP0739-20130205/48826_1 /TAXON_ID=385413 /ORGANISM="Thalassiosira miniscula, Strain CCMP1093" /LENGTH=34 /DNA_ID= /DNA_START= /DNA_END= /DNA_ORIENTATION=
MDLDSSQKRSKGMRDGGGHSPLDASERTSTATKW